MNAPLGMRELMQTYGLKMVRQKIAGGRSRVWLLGVMLTDGGEDRHSVVNGDGDSVGLAQLNFMTKLRGQTIVIEREYPDTCTVSLPTDFGAQDMVGSIPFDEMYDVDNPPPAPSSSALTGPRASDEELHRCATASWRKKLLREGRVYYGGDTSEEPYVDGYVARATEEMAMQVHAGDIPAPASSPSPSAPLWLGRPMVDEQTAGPLTLYCDDRRMRWNVTIRDGDEADRWVLSGSLEDIDAKTRAWLAPLAELGDELRKP